MSTQRLSDSQLRSMLIHIAGSTERLWDDEGAVLIAQFREHLVPTLLQAAFRSGRGTPTWLQSSEVLHVVLLELFSDHGRVANIIAEHTRDPWGYLAVCASKWVRKLCVSACAELKEHEFIANRDESSEQLTALNEMVTIAAQILQPHAPYLPLPVLERVLLWLAQNPPQRMSHEAEDRAAILVQFPSFTSRQISALANIAWGARPRRKETSLFAALLLDPDFRPSSSPTHIRALLHFRQVMRREKSYASSFVSIAA